MRLCSRFIPIFILVTVAVPRSEGALLDEVIDSTIAGFKNEAELIKNRTPEEWNAMKMKDYMNFKPKQIRVLLNEGRAKIPKRVQDMMNVVLVKNLTANEIVNKIKGSEATLYEEKKLFGEFTHPSMWSVQNITQLEDSVFKLPNYLILQCQNDSALKELKRKVDIRLSSISDTEKERYKRLQSQLLKKIKGQPEEWTNDTFASTQLGEIPPDMFAKVGLPQIAFRKNDILNKAREQNKEYLKRMYLTRILEAEKLSEERDQNKALDIANGLSGLTSSLVPEDFNEAVLKNTEIKKIIDENILRLVKTSDLSPKGVVMVMNEILRHKNITSEVVKDVDLRKLGLALPSSFQTAAENDEFENSGDIKSLIVGMKNAIPAGFNAKLDTLVSIVDKKNLESIRLSIYPSELIRRASFTMMRRLDEDDSERLLKENVNLDYLQVAALLTKVKDLKNNQFTTRAKEMIPLSRTNFENSNYIDFILNLPPGTVITMKTAENLMAKESNIGPADIRRFTTILLYIGSSEAMKFNETLIMGSLDSMENINPTSSACVVLRQKLDDYIQILMGSGVKDTIEGINGPDVEKIPVCVMAAFGAKRIAKLDADQKIILLERLGQMKNSAFSILRQGRMAIVKEGLKAMRGNTREGIQPGELTTIGNALVDVPANELMKASSDVIYDIVKKLNDMIMTEKRKPCLDSSQRGALANMVKQLKMKDVGEWESIDDVCCVLYMLNDKDQKRIKHEVMLTCSCDSDEPSPSTIIKEELCQLSLGEDFVRMKDAERYFKEAQKMAALYVAKDLDFEMDDDEDEVNTGRKKREANDEGLSICDRAAYGGANAFTDSEILRINTTIMFSCLNHFGRERMGKSKAETLAGHVNTHLDGKLDELTAKQVEDLNFILPGFGAADLAAFPTFQFGTFNNALGIMGMKKEFDSDQLKALGKKIISDWQRTSTMEPEDAYLLNQLFCGFKSQDISLKPETFRAAVNTLGKLENCPTDVLKKLAKQAVTAFGDSSTWGKAQVAELGGIINGLVPELFDKIPSSSMEGLVPRVIENMNSDYINTLDVEDILHLSTASALSFTDDQKKYFTADMKKALENIESVAEENGSCNLSGEGAVVLSTLLLYFVRQILSVA